MKLAGSKKSFTLIEMLIVIVIIGILTAALVPRLQDVQGRARDTKRKADFLQMENALRIYHIDNSKYPTANGLTGTSAVNHRGAQPRIAGLANYMTSIPTDPRNTSTTQRYTGQYAYVYGYIYKNEQTFMLISRLENTQDNDRCGVQLYKAYISTSITSCSTTSCRGGTDCGQLYLKSDVGP